MKKKNDKEKEKEEEKETSMPTADKGGDVKFRMDYEWIEEDDSFDICFKPYSPNDSSDSSTRSQQVGSPTLSEIISLSTCTSSIFQDKEKEKEKEDDEMFCSDCSLISDDGD